ncbi:Temperature sensing protein-related [Dorcoceras hygrometricum]|uniref:Temperature sensing protein-related n=1 Tax=Dorcoceras hygrometricum TaxID=472368 RepID=A0A2Z7BX28_9LAMI|nr:Temperature sensing protein-related [Dorcoceras hygrometricum]
MREEDINRCQIQEWYPKFRSASIKTIIHDLPETFVDYLLNDSGPFLLPVSILNDDALPNRVHNLEDEEDFVVLEGSDNEAQPISAPCFPELEMEIKASIESLGGAVFPKLNWSAPQDSSWISPTRSLRCTTFNEIALLLRSSDSLVNDLCHAYDSCNDKSASRPARFFLALRKWYPTMHPEMEFRCFVCNKVLIGICQREVTSFYPTLLARKPDLTMMIQQFFTEEVQENFESESYTFDIYVIGDERVKLLDFNPWGAFTLPLLFTWEELEEKLKEEDHDLEFRIVESNLGIRPSLKTAVPYDYLDTSPGSGWDVFLRNADEELRRQSNPTEAGA